MNWRPIRGWTRLLHERGMKADSMPERLLIGPGSPPSLDPVYPELSPPLEPCPFSGMVQKRVTAQGWLGSTPEGQRPQIRGLRAGRSLAVASSIPATQRSSPARLAERVVTPHAPMTLGPTTFPGRQKGG